MQKVGLAKGHLGLNDLKNSMGLDRCKALALLERQSLIIFVAKVVCWGEMVSSMLLMIMMVEC